MPSTIGAFRYAATPYRFQNIRGKVKIFEVDFLGNRASYGCGKACELCGLSLPSYHSNVRSLRCSVWGVGGKKENFSTP
jgi:hypothetical protein